MQMARGSLGLAVVDNKIYAIGGDAREGKWPYRGSIVGTNEEYDLATDTWTTKASMPTPRSEFAIATYQGKIYCFGGISNIDDSGRHITNVIEVYAPATDTWDNKSAMPTARWGLQANVVNGKIYLIGGYTPENASYSESITTLNQVYDPLTDSWTTASPMPVAGRGFESAVLDGKIHFIDGVPMESRNLLHLIYDPNTDIWSEGASSPAITGYSTAAATSGINATKQIHVFGKTGDLWEDKVSRTKVYNPATDTWTFGANMLTERLDFAVAVVNDVLYAIGGYTRKLDASHFGDTITLYATNEQYLPLGYGTPDPSYDAPPKIEVISPQQGAYSTPNIALDFTVNESISSMSYVLDGNTAVEIIGNVTLSDLSNGSHDLTVYATDLAGNTGVSETISFTVTELVSQDILRPSFVMGALVVLVISVLCVGMVFYWRKRRNSRH
ncbi:MAG: hypothetical protein M1540_02470 [Candidatus Bathyarchaeota archaeon]|nr:hypothetical protein [Candidatus Bathyarchaeota archaeon]